MAREHLSKRVLGTAAGVSVLACAIVGGWWLKAGYVPSQPIRVAQAFVADMEAGQFAQAYELTMKNTYTGRTVSELADIYRLNRCHSQAEQVLWTFPFQSNGNRLRRKLTGRAVDMPKITIEFAGKCPFNVTVRRTPSNAWKVFYFQAHAG
jgi:hypothetical protein